ncbi:MAG: polysaccharide pyruvyl transferase family protein [Candidatus Cryptobacteroides sp.]
MKIGILTQPLHSNYGGLLQNYALQQVLVRGGHQVETLDWSKNDSFRDALYRLKRKLLSGIFPKKFSGMPYLPSAKELAVIRRNTDRFVSSHIHCTRTITSARGFRRQARAGEYDAFVVGSDQCWRPAYNAFLPSMFLDFAADMDVCRIAYAASFGTDEWEYSPEQEGICSPLARKFNLVTVREDSAVGLCRDHLGVDAKHVLDPTMLLTAEDYLELIKLENEPPAAGNLFCHILDPDPRKAAFIDRVAKQHGLTPFQVLPHCQAENRTERDVKTRIEDCVYPSVTAWLKAFCDAEMIIVDSFHGMVFSILFNKPFWVLGNARRGLDRFTSLLKLFHLEDRLLDVNHLDVTDLPATSPCGRPGEGRMSGGAVGAGGPGRSIDWAEVNSIADRLREESKALLLESLHDPVVPTIL